jgi:hypothetical protein
MSDTGQRPTIGARRATTKHLIRRGRRCTAPAPQEKRQLEETTVTMLKHSVPIMGPGRTTLIACALGLTLAPALAWAQAAEVIAAGLNNPRGIAFAPNGDLYVAEAGIGGSGPCVASPSQPVQRCYGTTGAITRIKPEGGFERVLSGLPSLALPGGFAEGGVADISFLGTSLYATFGWGGDPANRAALGNLGKVFGTTWHVTPSGRYQVIADVAAHESANNPAGGPVDSNTYGILALPGRRIIADAGANALIELLANGRTRTLAVPPPITVPAPRESVPTSVALGPDGALYVGQLTGFPFFTGAASVLRVASDGSSVATFASGFTAIVDVAFDNGGALYVLEIASGQSTPFPPAWQSARTTRPTSPTAARSAAAARCCACRSRPARRPAARTLGVPHRDVSIPGVSTTAAAGSSQWPADQSDA